MSKKDDLIQAAIAAMPHAYAPYSHFQVGAALCDETGAIHTGVNVENAAYPQGSCAEAGAIAAMIMGAGRHITALPWQGAVMSYARLAVDAASVFANLRALRHPIYICGPDGLRETFTLAELLPASFGPDNLS